MGSGGINIRILYWHFMLSKQWSLKISFNRYHWDNRLNDGLFKVYEWDMKK